MRHVGKSNTAPGDLERTQVHQSGQAAKPSLQDSSVPERKRNACAANAIAFAPINRWVEISGLGRTRTYELLSTGDLIAVKAGKRTLVDVQHGLQWLRSQPIAKIDYPSARQQKVA